MRRKKRSDLALTGTVASVRMLCREEIVVPGLAAMSEADHPAPTPAECREVAAEVRRMAEEARLPEIRADLLDLAWRFERMADLFEASMDPKALRKN